MWSFWIDRTLQYCEQWMAAYEAEQLQALGGGSVISISGGGESQSRSDVGTSYTMENLRCCRRRMRELDPTKYRHIATSTKPDFSSLQY